MRFDEQTIMITGAAGQLGSAVAKAFADLHANLVLVDVASDRLSAAFGADSPRQLLAPTDLVSQAAVDTTIAKAIDRFGRIDVLCNIAGGFRMGTPVHETPDDAWDSMFDLNVRTLLNSVRAVVPRMLAPGAAASSTWALSLRRRAWRRWAPIAHRRAA